MTITTDYRKNKALMTDFHHVVGLAVRRKKVLAQRVFYSIFGVLGLASGVLLLVIDSDHAVALLGLLAGAFFAVRAVFYYQYLGFLSARLMLKQVDSVRYTFDDEGVTIDDALEHCVHPYHVFQGIYESRRTFVLLITNRIGYIIAKTDLSDEEISALRALLNARFEVPLKYFDV